jgi:HEAT repeat protein
MCKRFFIVVITALFAVSVVMGQSGNSEMSIEESYLQEAIELMIIRETSRSGSREQKLTALEHIDSALNRGSTNEELRSTLEYLSLEGTQNRIMQNGRLMNNYPDVRRLAVRYLGRIESKESKSALIRICVSDNEPMVLQEAIRSLGLIGLNDNDDAVNAIVRVTEHNLMSNSPPDNLIAIAALDALNKLFAKTNTFNTEAFKLIMEISGGPYPNQTRELAKQVGINLTKYAGRQGQQ